MRLGRRAVVYSVLLASPLAALPVLAQTSSATSTPHSSVANPCDSYLILSYDTVGTNCRVDDGQYGVGAGGGTYPGPGQTAYFDAQDGDYVYGAGYAVGKNYDAVTVCYGYYATNCHTYDLTP